MRAFCLLSVLCLLLAGCSSAQPQHGLLCNDDADCDSSDLCISGQCNPETAAGQGQNVSGDITASPLQQTLQVAVGQPSLSASATVTDTDAIAHAIVISCDGGAPSPSAQHLAASGTLTVTVAIPTPQAAGSSSINCAVTSASGQTTWTAFVITLHTTEAGAGGGSGGGSAGGSGGGSAGGSGGGSAGGSGGGSAGGSGGGSGGGGGTSSGFGLSISPASATVAAGASAQYTISTSVVSGSSETVSLSVSGLPAGVTGSFASPSVSSGQSTTLTLTAASSAAGASGTFTVAGDAASGNHSATASITVSGGTTGTTTMTLVTEPSGGFSSVYSAINNATSTLDMVMYELVDTTALNDLVAAAKRGVKVRVILDTNSEESTNTSAYDTLNATTNASAVWANKSFTVTHEKSMVVDAAVPGSALACIWTANLTSEDYADTRDFLLYENDPADIAAMESTFDSDFTNGGGSTYSPSSYTPPTGDHLLWSPTSSQSGLLAVINGAQSTLLLDEEEMEDDTIADALVARAKAGVSVKVAVTTDEATASLLSSMSAAGISIAEYPGTGTELYIHAKAIVADLGLADETAFLGSINCSISSLTANRELGLVFTDATSSTAKSIIASLATTLKADVACSSDSSCTMY